MRFVVRRGFEYGPMLLGFDARVSSGGDLEKLGPSYRELHLLRRDVPRLFSVDAAVWPSALEEVPDWTGPNHGLWTNRADLRERLTNAPEHWVIGVSVFARENGRVGPYLEPASPGELEDGWSFLGWDVADGSRLSGLANCGQGAALPEREVSHWAAALNEGHLFADFRSADDFRRHCDRTSLEHAPFYVFGLWHVAG